MITKRRLVSLACVGGLAFVAPIAAAYGQQATAKDKIVGTWKLISLFTKEIATGKKRPAP